MNFTVVCPGDKQPCCNPDSCEKAGWCKLPADAFARRAALSQASSPAPAPAVAPDPNPTATQPVNTPVPSQAQSAAATTEPGNGGLVVGVDVGTTPDQTVVWVSPEEQTPEERAEVARLSANVELAFPPVGFIDPTAELEKMLRITQKMTTEEKAAYPERVRAAILLHEAGKGPEPTDEELALAIFIKRTTDTPLTQEELEAKTTGKKKRDPAAPKAPRGKKAQDSATQLKNLLGL